VLSRLIKWVSSRDLVIKVNLIHRLLLLESQVECISRLEIPACLLLSHMSFLNCLMRLCQPVRWLVQILFYFNWFLYFILDSLVGIRWHFLLRFLRSMHGDWYRSHIENALRIRLVILGAIHWVLITVSLLLVCLKERSHAFLFAYIEVVGIV